MSSLATPIQLPPHFRETLPTDIKALAHPWHIADVDLPRHWQHTGGGQNILIGVADTGVDSDHKEIKGRMLEACSFVGGTYKDENGHGTHCTTIACGAEVGVAPNAVYMHAKVMDANGSGSSENVAKGIDWLADKGCHIISLSLGGAADDPYTRASVQSAVAAGIIVVAATGNERSSRVGYPARHCVGIGAIDRSYKLADFSNRGKEVDLVGFGVDILAGLPGNKYAAWSGTSMATPYIAGLIANRLSCELRHTGRIKTKKSNDLLLLDKYVKDLGKDGQDSSYGRGFPDLAQAFYSQLDPEDTPFPVPVPGARRVTVFDEDGTEWQGNLSKV